MHPMDAMMPPGITPEMMMGGGKASPAMGGAEMAGPPPMMPEDMLGAGPPPVTVEQLLWVPLDPSVPVDNTLCATVGGKAVNSPDGIPACAIAPPGELAPLPEGSSPIEESFAVRGPAMQAPPVM